LNATTQSYTVNVFGTFQVLYTSGGLRGNFSVLVSHRALCTQVAGLEVGLATSPYSNATLHFGGDAVLNVTSEVTVFTGASVSSSGVNNTLQARNFTINGGQILIAPLCYMTWKTSTISINNGTL
jgi:hypothetical protein